MPMVKCEILYRWEDLSPDIRNRIRRDPRAWYDAAGGPQRSYYNNSPSQVKLRGYQAPQDVQPLILDAIDSENAVLHCGDWMMLPDDVFALYGPRGEKIELPDHAHRKLVQYLMRQSGSGRWVPEATLMADLAFHTVFREPEKFTERTAAEVNRRVMEQCYPEFIVRDPKRGYAANPPRVWLPEPDSNQCYWYLDGSKIALTPAVTKNGCVMRTPVESDRPARFIACWARGPLLRSDNDEISYFDTAWEAAQCLFECGEGPASSDPLKHATVHPAFRPQLD